MDYFPFGDVRLNEKVGSFDSKRKYIGQEVDDATGLNYLNARYYNSKTGGFLSQDSVFLSVGNEREIESKTGLKFGDYLADPQAMNSYSYARNNPIRYSDENGNYAETAFDVTMLAWSVKDFRENPSFWNGVSVVLDAISVAVPGVPAVAGIINHGGDVAKALNKTDAVVENTSKIIKELPDDTLVVRGGSQMTPEAFKIDTHPSGVNGFSVESGAGLNLCDLCKNIPHNQVRVTTLGTIKQSEGDLIKTSGKSPNHNTVTNLNKETANNIFSKPIKNPVPKKLRNQ